MAMNLALQLLQLAECLQHMHTYIYNIRKKEKNCINHARLIDLGLSKTTLTKKRKEKKECN